MSDMDQMTFGEHPACVRALELDRPALLALARNHAPDPSIFEDHPPYFFQAEVSSNRLDSYYTRMDATSLRNYAEDATAGVSLQNSHQWRSLGFGRSVQGQFIGAQGNGVARTLVDFYSLPGLNLNGVATDDLIAGIRSGLVSDVSVGFYGGEYRCDICGRDMMRDWDCWHIPGFYYNVKDKDAKSAKSAKEKEEQVLATATILNARLSEVSTVYDGATPGALILKAERELEAGRLRPEMARTLEQRYRVSLSGGRRSWQGMGDRQQQQQKGSRSAGAPLTPEEWTTVQRALAQVGAEPGESGESALRELIGAAESADAVLLRIQDLSARIRGLEPLAQLGRTYRQRRAAPPEDFNSPPPWCFRA